MSDPTDAPAPEMIAYGATCTWWDNKARAAAKPPSALPERSSGGLGLPCCPYCGGVLYETTAESWYDNAPTNVYLGDRELFEWTRGRCYPNIADALVAYRERQAAGPAEAAFPQQLVDELTEIGSAFEPASDEFIDELRDAMADESLGAMLITTERHRVVRELGYSRRHDDEHDRGELIDAALAYIAHAADRPSVAYSALGARSLWPWSPESFRPGSPTRDLVKAGQFLAAEIDRRFRAEHLTDPVRPEATTWVQLGLDPNWEQLYANLGAPNPGDGQDWPEIVIEVPEALWREHERTWTRWADTLGAIVEFARVHGYDVERGRRTEVCDEWRGYSLGGHERWYVAVPTVTTDDDDRRHRTLDYLGWYDDEPAARAAAAALPDEWLTVQFGEQRTITRGELVVEQHTQRTVFARCERCGWEYDEHTAHGEPTS